MCVFVTLSTQCDQVPLLIAAGMAAERKVVYLQLLHAAAQLASPAVALQNLAVELAIARCIQSQSRRLAESFSHEAFCVMSERKVSRCGVGRNL